MPRYVLGSREPAKYLVVIGVRWHSWIYQLSNFIEKGNVVGMAWIVISGCMLSYSGRVGCSASGVRVALGQGIKQQKMTGWASGVELRSVA